MTWPAPAHFLFPTIWESGFYSVLWIPSKRTYVLSIPVLQFFFGSPWLTLLCKTLTVNNDLKRRINAFGYYYLQRIMENRWNKCAQLFIAPSSKDIWDIAKKAIYLRYLAHRVVFLRNSSMCRRSKGCSQSLWLEQVDRSCWQVLSIGKGLAWRFYKEGSPGLVYERGRSNASPVHAPFDRLMMPRAVHLYLKVRQLLLFSFVN